ncbi:MAG: hypothetical protein AAFQ71_10590 [Planctomycetota bacterium]
MTGVSRRTESGPGVLLYNPISGHGHLDSWLVMFCEAVRALGLNTAVLTPDPRPLERRGLLDDAGLWVADWKASGGNRLSRARAWFSEREAAWVGGVPAVGPKQAVARAVFRAQHTARRGVGLARKIEAGESEAGLLSPVEMAGRAAAAVGRSPFPIGMMLHMYLDMFRRGPETWNGVDGLLGLPWCGIRFAPAGPGGRETAWMDVVRSMRGLCVLDEGAAARYRATGGDRFVEVLPDITDTRLPERPSPLAAAIRARACGRRVVLLAGSLDSRKNIGGFLRLAAGADPDRWCFAMVGRVYIETLDPRTREALEMVRRDTPSNLFLHGEFVEDEADLNAAVAGADVVFAVYTSFEHTSNLMTKAASFGTPLLVSDAALMGRLVREYEIGAAIGEDDVAAWRDALDRLVASPPALASFRRYLDRVDRGRLAESLGAVIGACMGGAA